MDNAMEVRSSRLAASGTVLEGVGGAGALVLSILALLGIIPSGLVSIAGIVIGGALLVGGGTLAARYSRSQIPGQTVHRRIMGSGMAMESLCGISGLVLSILALLGTMPMILLPISVVIYGAALTIASGAMSHMESVSTIQGSISPIDEMIVAASGTEALIGTGAIILGILALSGQHPLVLTTIAMLAVGASVLLASFALARRVVDVTAD
jgi:hypothetical protein